MANSFGNLFKITTYGESHGEAVGVVIDGCPAGIKINTDKIQNWLNRRRPGQSVLTSPRDEKDKVEILSGIEQNTTLGTPITLNVKNSNKRSGDYSDIQNVYRPSHADYTTHAKYGIAASSGGGRASARETIGRVAAAAIAEQVLNTLCPTIEVFAWVDSVKDIKANSKDYSSFSRDIIEQTPLRCPDSEAQKKMEQLILDVKKKGDSVGGTIRCVIKNLPTGLGEPVFDKLEADLAKATMSLPATKGFEVGEGFASCLMYGSEHNDAFAIDQKGKIYTTTNHSGGIQGGISNGQDVLIRVAFKPVATIFKSQQTVNKQKQQITFSPRSGRHDPCVLPRAVPMVEAMVILVIADHFLRHLISKAI
ncbi:MAG: chorismate synthase [Bdellovibrionota bacterium]